jgi:Transposase IS66 family
LLPIGEIQAYLKTLRGLSVSIGEIVELQHRLRERTQAQVNALKAEIRASPAVQADETGWREDGLKTQPNHQRQILNQLQAAERKNNHHYSCALGEYPPVTRRREIYKQLQAKRKAVDK